MIHQIRNIIFNFPNNKLRLRSRYIRDHTLDELGCTNRFTTVRLTAEEDLLHVRVTISHRPISNSDTWVNLEMTEADISLDHRQKFMIVDHRNGQKVSTNAAEFTTRYEHLFEFDIIILNDRKAEVVERL